MNERIKQLAEQATEHYSNGQERAFDREKFAELIVKECMKVAVFKDADTNIVGYMAIYRLQGRSTAAQMIKEHFGVES